MTDAREVNIYFKNQNDTEKVFRDLPSSSHERYIILMNETLQTENRVLTKRNSELEKRIDELEEENENYDTSKRYTRGLLKNFVELERLHSKISDNNKKTLVDVKKYVKNFIESWTFKLRIVESIIILVLTTSFYYECCNYMKL